MPVYAYRALNDRGKTVKGIVDADSPQMARQRLRADGLHPVDIREASKVETLRRPVIRRPRFTKLRPGAQGRLTEATRQAATLLSAGLPLVNVLATIQEQAEDAEFGRTLALVRDDVTSGESLANALSRHPDLFPQDYIQLVKAGELGGALDQVLERLAVNLERSQGRRARISAALAYPAFMSVVGTLVLIFLLSFIIPNLTGLFDRLGAALPWPTRLLLAISGFLEVYWWAAGILLVGLLILVDRSLKTEKGYRRAEDLAFKLPLAGRLMKKLLIARAMSGLAVMTGGGVPLTTALKVTARGLGRSAYKQALEQAAEAVGQGRSLADGLEESGLFPPVVKKMVAVGETSGALTEMIDRLARAYEEETDRTLSTLTSLVEPVIILIIGLIVGFVVMAVLLPIFDLSGLVG